MLIYTVEETTGTAYNGKNRRCLAVYTDGISIVRR